MPTGTDGIRAGTRCLHRRRRRRLTWADPVAQRDPGPLPGPTCHVTAATRNCPETATKLPAGGHEKCPVAAMRSARHDVVCLAASRG